MSAVKEAGTCHSFVIGSPAEYPLEHLTWIHLSKRRVLSMRKMVFVPLSDEMIYENPELITGPIRAFGSESVSFPGLVHAGEKAQLRSRGRKHQVRGIDRRVASAPIRSGTSIRT